MMRAACILFVALLASSMAYGQEQTRRAMKADKRAKDRELTHCSFPWSKFPHTRKERKEYTRSLIVQGNGLSIVADLKYGRSDSILVCMQSMAELYQTSDLSVPFGSVKAGLLLALAGKPYTGLAMLAGRSSPYGPAALFDHSLAPQDTLGRYLAICLFSDFTFLKKLCWATIAESPTQEQIAFLKAIDLNRDWLSGKNLPTYSLLASRRIQTMGLVKGTGIYERFFSQRFYYILDWIKPVK